MVGVPLLLGLDELLLERVERWFGEKRGIEVIRFEPDTSVSFANWGDPKQVNSKLLQKCFQGVSKESELLARKTGSPCLPVKVVLKRDDASWVSVFDWLLHTKQQSELDFVEKHRTESLRITMDMLLAARDGAPISSIDIPKYKFADCVLSSPLNDTIKNRSLRVVETTLSKEGAVTYDQTMHLDKSKRLIRVYSRQALALCRQRVLDVSEGTLTLAASQPTFDVLLANRSESERILVNVGFSLMGLQGYSSGFMGFIPERQSPRALRSASLYSVSLMALGENAEKDRDGYPLIFKSARPPIRIPPGESVRLHYAVDQNSQDLVDYVFRALFRFDDGSTVYGPPIFIELGDPVHRFR